MWEPVCGSLRQTTSLGDCGRAGPEAHPRVSAISAPAARCTAPRRARIGSLSFATTMSDHPEPRRATVQAQTAARCPRAPWVRPRCDDGFSSGVEIPWDRPVSYTHLRAHETPEH